jgi:drug/metabolite transporter (DMT)-like permease
MKPAERTAYIALIVLTIVWGYNWVVIKIATLDADAFSISAIRLILGAVSLFIAIIVTRGSLKPVAIGPTIVLGILQTTLFTILQTFAVISGGAGKTAILAYTMPFWLVLLAWPFLHERVTRFGWIALALAAIGIACILTPLDFSNGLLGKVLAVLGAISWAISAIYAKRLRRRHKVELLSLTAWQMTFGMIPLALIALVIPSHHVALTPSFIEAILYIGLPGTGLAWLLWLFILHRLSAGTAGIASLLTPVMGVAFAWLQLGERPGLLELVGIACIVAALVINTLAPVAPATQEPAAAAEA